MIDFYIDMVKCLKISIFAYEYTGYGILRNVDRPSDLSIIEDIQAAYIFVIKQLYFPWNKIIL